MVSLKHVLVLTSGGIDSTACLHFFKNQDFTVEALFVDFGQPGREREAYAAKQITSHYDIHLNTVEVDSNWIHKDGLIVGRNAFLLITALMYFNKPTGIISTGIHKGTDYYDCSKQFVDSVQAIFDGYTGGTMKIYSPFLNFSKREIFEYCKIEQVPLKYTYSCEAGLDQPCGICNSCKDLQFLYASEDK